MASNRSSALPQAVNNVGFKQRIKIQELEVELKTAKKKNELLQAEINELKKKLKSFGG